MNSVILQHLPGHNARTRLLRAACAGDMIYSVFEGALRANLSPRVKAFIYAPTMGGHVARPTYGLDALWWSRTQNGHVPAAALSRTPSRKHLKTLSIPIACNRSHVLAADACAVEYGEECQ